MRIIARSGSGNRGPHAGAAAVELAVILPLLMLVLLGAVDFGRFAYTYIAVTNAARAGAALASISPYTAADLGTQITPGYSGSTGTWRYKVWQAVVDEMSQVGGYNVNNLTVVSDPIYDTPTSSLWRARVNVSYPFQTLVSWPGIPSNVTLQQVVTMRSVR